MLTREHGIYEVSGFTVEPDRLGRRTHAHYVDLAARMLDVYRRGVGLMRRTLHRRVEEILEDEADCPVRRIRSFIKLLDDASEYQTDRDGRAAKLRQRVFDLAAPLHPLVERPDQLFDNDAAKVKERIAGELGMSWPEVDRAMFADFPGCHTLRVAPDLADERDLLSRYNVGQAQVLLYSAVEMVVTARRDFKRLFRHTKLSRLLHEIDRVSDREYRIHFTGPASVLGKTRRYGVEMATFLPALLACGDWKMQARVKLGWREATFALTSGSGLRSHLSPSAPFDSQLEEKFAAKFGPKRDGWTLEREGDFLSAGQKVFVPDFVFRHEDGTVAYFEIVGYWTPEYLEAKVATLRRFPDALMLISVASPLLMGEGDVPGEVLTHKAALKIGPILERLESMRAG